MIYLPLTSMPCVMIYSIGRGTLYATTETASGFKAEGLSPFHCDINDTSFLFIYGSQYQYVYCLFLGWKRTDHTVFFGSIHIRLAQFPGAPFKTEISGVTCGYGNPHVIFAYILS